MLVPRMYDYAPVDSKVHKTEQEKELARQKMFDYMDLKSTGASLSPSGGRSVTSPQWGGGSPSPAWWG